MPWRCLNRAKKVRGHIYVLGVSMWPLSMDFIYTYMNGHFACLVHAPPLSLFYKNEQHKYHTSGGVKLGLCLNHSLLMSMWENYQPWHYNRANKWQSRKFCLFWVMSYCLPSLFCIQSYTLGLSCWPSASYCSVMLKYTRLHSI